MLRDKGQTRLCIGTCPRTLSCDIPDLIQFYIDGQTKTPLLRCFPFISKLKAGYIITTGLYMNYQTFSNLQFGPLLKNFFQSIHIDLKATSG